MTLLEATVRAYLRSLDSGTRAQQIDLEKQLRALTRSPGPTTPGSAAP